jgi:hypothetical protein
MKINQKLNCASFPYADVRHECHRIPDIAVQPGKVSILMISEAAPADPSDYYYAKGDPLFGRTTVQAFRDAGADVSSG